MFFIKAHRRVYGLDASTAGSEKEKVTRNRAWRCFMRMMVCIMCGFLALVAAHTAHAQTKFAGKQQCAKPDPNYTVPVTNQANHAMALSGLKCTWSQGDIGGDRLKDEEDTFTSDMSGNTSRDRGYGVGSVVNGDKYFLRFDGTTLLKGKALVSGQCTWMFTGGTGKLKDIKGKGTCKGACNADGTSSWDIEGTYQLSTAAKSK